MKNTITDMKNTLQGVNAALSNTQKQTQEGCQIEETKTYGPNERTEQNPRKKKNMLK